MTALPPRADSPSIARSCGECVAYILKAIRTPIARPSPHASIDVPSEEVRTVRAMFRQEQVGDVVHRRIVIDQIVVKDSSSSPSATSST